MNKALIFVFPMAALALVAFKASGETVCEQNLLSTTEALQTTSDLEAEKHAIVMELASIIGKQDEIIQNLLAQMKTLCLADNAPADSCDKYSLENLDSIVKLDH